MTGIYEKDTITWAKMTIDTVPGSWINEFGSKTLLPNDIGGCKQASVRKIQRHVQMMWTTLMMLNACSAKRCDCIPMGPVCTPSNKWHSSLKNYVVKLKVGKAWSHCSVVRDRGPIEQATRSTRCVKSSWVLSFWVAAISATRNVFLESDADDLGIVVWDRWLQNFPPKSRTCRRVVNYKSLSCFYDFSMS